MAHNGESAVHNVLLSTSFVKRGFLQSAMGPRRISRRERIAQEREEVGEFNPNRDQRRVQELVEPVAKVIPIGLAAKTQTYIVFLMGFSNFASSMAIGFSPGAMASILKDERIGVSENGIIWIISLNFTGAVLGSILAQLVVKYNPRMFSSLLCSMISVYSWVQLAWADSYSLILTSRFISGVCVAVQTSVNTYYLSETITEAHLPKTDWIKSISSTSGMYVMCILGAYLHWQTLAMVGAVVSALPIVPACFLPESPYILFRMHGWEPCLNVLRGLLLNEEAARAEFEKLRYRVLWQMAKERTKKDIFEESNSFPFYITFISYICQQATGICVYLCCLTSIVSEIGGMEETRYLAAFYFLLYTLADLVFVQIHDCTPRKYMIRISSLFMGVFSCLLGFLLLLKNHTNLYGFLTTMVMYLCVGGILVCYCYGWACVPDLFFRESVPHLIKHEATDVPILMKWLTAAVITLAFIKSRVSFGIWFVCFAVLTYFGFIFTDNYMVETLGASPEDIKNYSRVKCREMNILRGRSLLR